MSRTRVKLKSGNVVIHPSPSGRTFILVGVKAILFSALLLEEWCRGFAFCSLEMAMAAMASSLALSPFTRLTGTSAASTSFRSGQFALSLPTSSRLTRSRHSSTTLGTNHPFSICCKSSFISHLFSAQIHSSFFQFSVGSKDSVVGSILAT